MPTSRRKFLIALSGATTGWPLAARAQQTAVPVVGYLSLGSPIISAQVVAAFKQGLAETGYIEGKNVAIEYRYAESHFDRLPELAADLVRRRPAVIWTGGPPSVRAVKALTATIPMVFRMGEDPVKEGLIASLNRPGGNITGVSYFTNHLFPKRLQLLHEIVPKAAALALLVNPDNPNADPDSEDARAAAVALGRELLVLRANTGRGIDEAFLAISAAGRRADSRRRWALH
jgi:putative tryptophan/tyrosine transport system substrate-binding protein